MPEPVRAPASQLVGEAARGVLARGVFVGRAAEMALLKDGLENARRGCGRLFMLVGEAGIGKTRTAEELVTHARQDHTSVLIGRCYEGDGAPAFWPWVQILRAYMHGRPPKALLADMGRGALDIAQLVPDVRQRLPDLPAPPAVEPEQARFRLFDSVTTFLKNAASREPLVLILDDLHWADKPSLLLLHFVAREMAEARLFVVGTYRDVEVDRTHPLTAVVNELRRERLFERIVLRGLPQDDVRALITGIGGHDVSDAFVWTMFQQTEGNPFFVEEILRHLVEEGIIYRETGRWTSRVSPEQMGIPEGVRAVIGRRLARLGAACNQVLTIAAVIGRDFDVSALEAVGEPLAVPLQDVLEEAVAARVITVVPQATGHFRFAHALIRETLYEALPRGRRVQLHQQIAEVLEQLYGTHPEPHLAELAYHFFEGSREGGALDKAIAYAVQAGKHATALLAYEEGAEHYVRALQGLERSAGSTDLPAEERQSNQQRSAPQRCGLLLALGEAQTQGGEPDRARETFLQAAGVARTLPAPEPLARAALGFEVVSWDFEGGEFDEVYLGLLEEAAAALGDADSVLRARVLARLARLRHRSISPERRAAVSREAVAMARRVGDPATLAVALLSRNLALWDSDDAENRLARATEIVRMAEQAGDRGLALEGRLWRTTTLLELGDIRAVDGEVHAYVGLAEELRQPRYLWMATWLRAMRASLDGRFDEAEGLVHQALAVGQRVHEPNAVQAFSVQMMALRRDQGRLEEIEPTVRGFIEQYPTITAWRCALLMLHSELGREAEVRSAFEQSAANDFSDVPADLLWLTNMSILCEACALLGDVPRAARLYEMLLPHAARNIVVGAGAACLGSVARPLGLLARTMSRWEEAITHFEVALRFNSQMRARPLVARTQYDYARMLLVAGEAVGRLAIEGTGGSSSEDRAVQLLGQALGAARELRMRNLIDRIEGLGLGIAGQRSPTGSPARRLGGSPEGAIFRKEGDFWTLVFGDAVIHLRDSKGLQYLAYLLRYPGRELHAITVACVGRIQPVDVRRAVHGAAASILDGKAKAAYRQRLEELRDQLEEAERFNDLGRAARARTELDAIAQQLTSAIGVGGRDRKTSSDAERARLTVTQCIKAALKKIRASHPALGDHLATRVKTGYFCAYTPDPDRPISWQL